MNDQNNNYSNQTDITFMLSGTITDPEATLCRRVSEA